MALASESVADLLSKEDRRLSIREDLNIHFKGLVLNDKDDDSSDDIDEEYIKDPETAEMATMERQWLKNRKSLTMMNQLATLQLTKKAGVNGSGEGEQGDASSGANGTSGPKDPKPLPQPTKEHFLAAKKSIEDMSAWINAAGLDDDD
ncbi:hypothetical protein BGW42_005291 [Actinomortierella wolfii]|nr:hypothetical protein BGW42_005291 [Actinomortierella wolfii]KAG0245388.1 hypothetical protein BGW41_000015 [Actinomortierella wolfii]